MSYEDENRPDDWKLDNGDPLPQRKTITNCKWDKDTRTFTGSYTWIPRNF